MPQYIRHLPGNVSKLFDKNTSNIPKNHSFFNPNVSKNIIYLRAVEHTEFADKSYVLLFNTDNSNLHKIDSPSNFLEKNINTYQGIEDLRIIHWRDKVWFTASSTHGSKKMTNELLIGYFDKNYKKIEELQPVDIKVLPVKNICPFIYEDNLLLFDVYKKLIYKFDDGSSKENKNKNKFVATNFIELKESSGINIDEFRGSTSPVHLHGNTWGCVIHDAIFNDQDQILPNSLSYIHYWMEFDIKTGSITFLSSPFWILKWGIEYVSGILYNKEKDLIQLFIGIDDNEAFVYHTSLWRLRIGK